MKSIMLSIKPQWVEKIINKEKTIEIRKTKPNCELPCKVYIYCTMPEKQENRKPHSWEVVWLKRVVAEFELNKVDIYLMNSGFYYDEIEDIEKTCLNYDDLKSYGKGKTLYAWHIDNLKIYDKPKELSEFYGFIPNNKCKKHENGFACDKCDAYDKEHDTCLALYYCHKPIKRPPQSYMFVEELEE